MPELPEVENVIRTMRTQLESRSIVSLVHVAEHLHNLPFGLSTEYCWIGKEVSSLARHGKYIQLFFSDGSGFVIHLRMTGKFFFAELPEESKHTHFICKLDNGIFMHFNDVRKFARFQFIPAGQNINQSLPNGPDALSVSADYITKAAIKWPGTKLKTFLLDQNKIAGIGNIYADEICHAAGIVPDTPLNSIQKADGERLAAIIREMLARAIKLKGTTLRDYRDAAGKQGEYQFSLKVYGQTNCGSCGAETVKMKLAGRTTRFCPICQS
jgi:formamidopyrimidine-DNA glycosylase